MYALNRSEEQLEAHKAKAKRRYAALIDVFTYHPSAQKRPADGPGKEHRPVKQQRRETRITVATAEDRQEYNSMDVDVSGQRGTEELKSDGMSMDVEPVAEDGVKQRADDTLGEEMDANMELD